MGEKIPPLLLPFRNLALVLLVVVIINSDEKHFAFVRIEGVKIFFVLYLLQRIAGGCVVFEFDDNRRVLSVQVDWHENQIGKPFARGQFLENCIVVEGIDISIGKGKYFFGKPNPQRGIIIGINYRILATPLYP